MRKTGQSGDKIAALWLRRATWPVCSGVCFGLSTHLRDLSGKRVLLHLRSLQLLDLLQLKRSKLNPSALPLGLKCSASWLYSDVPVDH